MTSRTKRAPEADAFARMRPTAFVINVGRGPTVDQQALYDALRDKRIAGAAIDAWYDYPSPDQANVFPSALPFHQLPNIVMTPHMSGWTAGTIRRRQKTMADNIRRRESGEPCVPNFSARWSATEPNRRDCWPCRIRITRSSLW